uniref:Uncharacterized protein n=1 Tax=Periophthalmus magnuspinnatus TaxID=409849 RepID=A0A3B3ZLW3_9GOBI
MQTSATLKPSDTLFHSVLRFITGDEYKTHHCSLYEKVGWPQLSVRREQHCIKFIYEGRLDRLPGYLTCLLNIVTGTYNTKFQDCQLCYYFAPLAF